MSGLKIGITESIISENEIVSFIDDDLLGGQCLFLGKVRDNNKGKSVSSMHYQGFVPLAENVLEEIGKEALQKWGEDLRVYIAHRLGNLTIGEASVGIGVGSRHRAAAFESCRYIIEQIKERLPVWKQEFYTDGSSQWLDGTPLTASEPSV